MIEKEIKILLSKEQYEKIEKIFSWKKKFNQTNFYYGDLDKIDEIWHPIYGVIYDEEKNIRQGKYEKYSKPRDRGGCTLRGCTRILQISMFSLSL
jgi:hypothetical protein